VTHPDRESRFDHVDLTTLTIVELEDYLSKIVDRHVIIPDPFFARSYELRIAEVQAHVQREVAIRNRRETERQDQTAVGLTDRLREALCFALREVVHHNSEYKHVTPPEQIAAWRALIAEACAEAKNETNHV
jgi:hypothetical protein